MKRKPDYIYRCVVDRCVDGDTVDARVDLGFTVWVNVRFRLYGINTPERGQDGYKAATERLEELLSAPEVYVESRKTGKYGRWLGVFYVPDESDAGFVDINAKMILEGYAAPYMEKR